MSAPSPVERAAMIVRGDDASARSELAAIITSLEERYPDPRHVVRRHAAAAQAWLDGNAGLALERYGAILVDRPHDLAALEAAHALDFRLGLRRMLRDRVAQLLPHWKPTMCGYASVLAMYAFGLEENGQLRRAEKAARRALALEPGHAGAIHVMAHIMEMRGQANRGLAFLAGTESFWSVDPAWSVHIAWHRALFQLDMDHRSGALATYDRAIATGTGIAALADAAALLWRLQLRKVDLGARWQQLADRWEHEAVAGARPFVAVHAVMAFAATGRRAAAARVLDALKQHAATSSRPSLPDEALAEAVCEALLAFARGDYGRCIELLGHVRDVAHRCGGSVAQCDVIHLTYTEAALRGHQARLARALVAERAAQRPASRLNQWLQRRAGISVTVPA